MTAQSIRVLIIENHVPLANLLVEILQRECNLEVVGVAQSFNEAAMGLLQAKPKIVIADWHLPDACGQDTARLICAQFPAVRLILLNDENEHRYSEVALKQGAAACVCKSLIATDLVPTVMEIAYDSSSVK